MRIGSDESLDVQVDVEVRKEIQYEGRKRRKMLTTLLAGRPITMWFSG